VSAIRTPYGWKTIPLRYVCELYPSVSFDGLEEEDDVTFLPMDRVKNGYFISNTDKFSKYAPSYNAFEDGDIVLAKVTPCFENGNIAIAEDLVRGKGFGSSELFVIRATGAERKFLFYYFQSSAFKQEGEASMTGAGGLKRVSPDVLRQHHVPFPSQDVQGIIANYLDRETARIDGLIDEKQRMLALLEEKRVVLISRVVTRGLDFNAPLKPSGQEWLGEIPAHWPTTKFSWDVFISEGQVDPEDDRFTEMILVAPNHIESRTGQVTYAETSADQGAISGKYLCKQGDVLYSKIRPALRKVALAEEDCLCSADMYALRPSERLMPEYLQYFLLSEDFSTWAELESARVAMPKINRETLSAIRIPVPPLEEQERIVSEIRNGTKRIDLQRKAVRGSVELLKERRAALITAAVTGQIPLNEMQNLTKEPSCASIV
jgi:type I restriction enzyme S subunit